MEIEKLNIQLLSDLVAFKSITPDEKDVDRSRYCEEAIDYCSEFLGQLGFSCQKLKFGAISNLYAKLGDFKENLCFAGHLDVVPPLDGWATDPFTLTEKDGKLYGRGTTDMKGPFSSCLVAIYDFVKHHTFQFSISVMLTTGEETMELDGMEKVVEFLQEKHENITGCILCECGSPKNVGEYIKIGCRGHLNVDLISHGQQCHVVHGKILGNHLHDFVEFLSNLTQIKLDKGSQYFAPSTIELTSVDVGNPVRNVIPHTATAKLDARFNDHWTAESLENFIRANTPKQVEFLSRRTFASPFISNTDEKFTAFLSDVIESTLKQKPGIGTIGGGSDAASIRYITNVVEIGSRASEAHIVNEFIGIEDLHKLRIIYFEMLKKFPHYLSVK